MTTKANLGRNTLLILGLIFTAIFVVAVYADAAALTVDLYSPATKTNTTNTTTEYQFGFLEGNNSTASCAIVINGAKGYGLNASTANNTSTTIVANSTLAEGNYSWNINCTVDAEDNDSDSDRIITIKTTAPTVNLLTAANYGTSYYTDDNTPDLQFNFTDWWYPTTTCEMLVNNTGYGHNLTETSDNNTAITLTANASLVNGSYTWTVNCTDPLALEATGTALTLVINNQTPTAGFSPANSSTGVSATATIKVTFNNLMNESTINTSTMNLTDSGGGYVAGAITTSDNLTYTYTPNTPLIYATTYNFTVTTTVEDFLNHPIAAQYVIRFTTVTGVTGGGGGGGTTAGLQGEPTFDIPEGTSKDVSMIRNNAFYFDVAGEKHKFKVSKIVGTTATIVVTSDVITFDISVGETKEVDVDVDGHNDFSVTLNRVKGGIADFTVTVLEAVAAVTAAEEAATTTAAEEAAAAAVTTEEAAVTTAPISTGYLVGIVVVIILIIAGGYWYSSKGSK